MRSNVNEVLKYASEKGILMGLYLTAMSACILLSLRWPGLPSLLVPLTACCPVWLWLLLRPMARNNSEDAAVSSLWLAGIYIFIFATLICGLLTASYLLFLHPGFIGEYMASSIAAVEASPMAPAFAEQVEVMRQAMDRHLLPSPMEFTISMMWATAFFGSIVSLIVAFFMNMVYRRRGSTQNA